MIDPGAPFDNPGQSPDKEEEVVEFRWRLISTGLLLLFIGAVGAIEYFRGA